MAQPANTPSDLDIMMFLDGELRGEEAKAVEAFLERDEEASNKAQALGQIGDVIRTSVELEVDTAETRLAALWEGVDRGINSNGVSKERPASAGLSKEARAEEKATQALVEQAASMGRWQGHLITGALVAAAVAILMYVTRPERVVETQTVRQQQVAPPTTMPVALKSQEPVIENLEVYEGTGVIMTIAGDEADEGASSSAVIWISDDTDVVEDPI